MTDTSGFYKADGSTLLYGQNFIVSSQRSLLRENKDSYTYPIDGWMWFDSEEAAREHFNIPASPPPPDMRPEWMKAMDAQQP